jgi:hypothetical protein
LVGEHLLDGVDMFDEQVKAEWGDDFELCEMMRFRLDGVTYLAIEDPCDGYRSSMREIKVSDTPMKNIFPVHRVIVSHRTKGEFQKEDDVLEFRSVLTGKLVLEVGTSNVDDYYPCFVARFTPENLAD